MGANIGIQHNIRLSIDSSDALAALMRRTGLNRNQAINFCIMNTARGHDGYYAQMAAFQSAIAASAALFVGQKLCESQEEADAFLHFAVDLARAIHGPMPEAPNHLAFQASHDTVAKAFFAALKAHHSPG